MCFEEPETKQEQRSTVCVLPGERYEEALSELVTKETNGMPACEQEVLLDRVADMTDFSKWWLMWCLLEDTSEKASNMCIRDIWERYRTDLVSRLERVFCGHAIPMHIDLLIDIMSAKLMGERDFSTHDRDSRDIVLGKEVYYSERIVMSGENELFNQIYSDWRAVAEKDLFTRFRRLARRNNARYIDHYPGIRFVPDEYCRLFGCTIVEAFLFFDENMLRASAVHVRGRWFDILEREWGVSIQESIRDLSMCKAGGEEGQAIPFGFFEEVRLSALQNSEKKREEDV